MQSILSVASQRSETEKI